MPKVAINPCFVTAIGRETIAPECPLDHTPNAETVAAIEEGHAMREGRLPSRHLSLEELMEDLYSLRTGTHSDLF
jgi:hypothetical protein